MTKEEIETLLKTKDEIEFRKVKEKMGLGKFSYKGLPDVLLKHLHEIPFSIEHPDDPNISEDPPEAFSGEFEEMVRKQIELNSI